MQKALISILMPVKNTAAFLPECLNSIVGQTETNWELWAVNDHSTDHSLDILQEFAQKDPRIKVLNNSEKGIIEALRLAYTHSIGEWITRMDSDDIMLPQKLAVLKKQLLEHGEGALATGQVYYFSQTEIGNGYWKYQNWLNQLTAKGRNFSEIYKECVIPSPCWMVHRSDLEKCAAFKPNRYPEDYDLCFRFYENKLIVLPSHQILHRWRDYSTRTSRTDTNYADNRFLDLKLYYFLKLDFDENRPLVVWGAGKKGKFIAHYLIEEQLPFYWICNNVNKIGKSIYDQLLKPISFLEELENPQLIIAVAGEIAQEKIQSVLAVQNWKPIEHYFFFC